MKPSPRAESKAAKPKQKRAHRPRPTPKWLKAPLQDGPEAVAQRRCLLVLSVLSGEQPVTDAIEATGVSRQLYYQLEEKALKAMLRALAPAAENSEAIEASLAAQLNTAQERVKQLEVEKRRTERLLLLTRKLLKPGLVTVGRGGRPRKYGPRSTKAGRASSSAGTEKSQTTSPDTSTAVPTSAPLP
jgi:hypothetical protein